VPLGGCGEFGMNMTAYLYEDKVYVVDCGVMFSDSQLLGADLVIPDVNEFFEQNGAPEAYFITHGHEDHIGALPHIARKWQAPIYVTAWANELILNRLERLEITNSLDINVVEAGDRISGNDFDVEYVNLNHSIPMSCGLLITAGEKRVFHSGDFRIDDTPVERPANIDRLKSIGKNGVDLLLVDSTNAHKSGSSPSESTVRAPIEDIVSKTKGAVFFTTFASNFYRLQTAATVAEKFGRTLVLVGKGVENSFSIATELGLYTSERSLINKAEEVDTLPRNEIMFLISGCQGEPRSALSRIASGESRFIKLCKDDSLLLSSRIIPGNEKAVNKLQSYAELSEANVFSTRNAPEIHCSGHGYFEDIKKLVSLVKPKHIIPVHGNFSQLRAGTTGLSKLGHSLMLVQSGDVAELTDSSLEVVDHIEIGTLYVDNDSNAVITYDTLRERLRIGWAGCAIVHGCYSKREKKWLSPLEIELIGLGFPVQVSQDDFIAKAKKGITSSLAEKINAKTSDDETLSEQARISLRRKLHTVLNKKPIVKVKLTFQ